MFNDPDNKVSPGTKTNSPAKGCGEFQNAKDSQACTGDAAQTPHEPRHPQSELNDHDATHNIGK